MTNYSPKVELEARFLGVEDGQIKLYFMDARKQGIVVEGQEFKGEWLNATMGQHINVRVTGEYADSNNLLGAKTYKAAPEDPKRDYT
jgi:hypothetical protein